VFRLPLGFYQILFLYVARTEPLPKATPIHAPLLLYPHHTLLLVHAPAHAAGAVGVREDDGREPHSTLVGDENGSNWERGESGLEV
jgi:hypothetical protein